MTRTRFAIALGLLAVWAMPARAQLVFVTNPGDPIIGVGATPGSATSTMSTVGTAAGVNNYPAAEAPPNAIDRIFAPAPLTPFTKYLNFAETNVGLLFNASGTAPVIALQFVTGNDAPERDPINVVLEGTNDPNATTTLNSTWTLIYSGDAGLVPFGGAGTRGIPGDVVNFANSTSYDSYRLIITSVRNGATANSVQFEEIGLIVSGVPEPSSMALAGLGLAFVVRRRFKGRATG